jgi:hypothetical protein
MPVDAKQDANERFLKAEYETTGLHYLYHQGDITEDELKAGIAYANESLKILRKLYPEMRMRLSSWDITGVRAGWPHSSTNTYQISKKIVQAIKRLQMLTQDLRKISPQLAELIRDLALETFEPSNPLHVKTLKTHSHIVKSGLQLLVLHNVVRRAQKMRRSGLAEALEKISQDL